MCPRAQNRCARSARSPTALHCAAAEALVFLGRKAEPVLAQEGIHAWAELGAIGCHQRELKRFGWGPGSLTSILARPRQQRLRQRTTEEATLLA
jgi:hypothetical protein